MSRPTESAGQWDQPYHDSTLQQRWNSNVINVINPRQPVQLRSQDGQSPLQLWAAYFSQPADFQPVLFAQVATGVHRYVIPQLIG